MNKEIANIVHFKRRVFERYLVDLTNKEIQDAIQLIQKEGSKYKVYKSSRTRTVFDIPIQGVVMRVVYDKNQKNFITALTRDE